MYLAYIAGGSALPVSHNEAPSLLNLTPHYRSCVADSSAPPQRVPEIKDADVMPLAVIKKLTGSVFTEFHTIKFGTHRLIKFKKKEIIGICHGHRASQ